MRLEAMGRLLGLLVAILWLSVSGCGQQEANAPSDDESASFGGGKAKSDGRYSECELREILGFLNESTTDGGKLTALGVNSKAAESIVAHRLGLDGKAGTGDDNIFDDLQEVDDVPWVGSKTLDQLVGSVKERCEFDLTTRPYIDKETFDGVAGDWWIRDGMELEAVMAVTGINGQLLHEILLKKNASGNTIYSRVCKNTAVEAFTYDYPLDEIPWTKAAQEAREQIKYVAWTIESGRFEPGNTGLREMSLGRDIMDDTYFDTRDYDLLRNDILLRGRARWDTDDVVRRLLIALKAGCKVGEDGMKRCKKMDVRTDSATPEDRVSLDNDVMGGIVNWEGTRKAVDPEVAIYKKMGELNLLRSVGGHEGVLVLDPKVHVRGIRNRFHFDELWSADEVYQNGLTRLGEVVTYLQTALDNPDLPQTTRTAFAQLLDMGNKIQDGSLLRSEAQKRLAAAGLPTDPIPLPLEFESVTLSYTEIDRLRIISETADATLHGFASQLEDVENDLSETRGLDYDEFAPMFQTWLRATDANLSAKTIALPFLDRFKEFDGTPAVRDAKLQEFNQYGETRKAANDEAFKGFTSVTPEIWTAIGKHLFDQVIKDDERQIATAGIIANAMWFALNRKFYVPSSYNVQLIDTMDMTEMISLHEWENIPEAQRTPATLISPEKVFHTTLVNEVQIELGEEGALIKRIEELQAKIDADPNDEESKKQLAGATFIMQQYNSSLITLGQLKGNNVLSRLKSQGAPQNIEWIATDDPKGKSALMMLGDFE